MVAKQLGLLDSYWVLILPNVASGQVFGIFLLRTFFAGLPEDLFEAARVDGASTLQSFFRICVPLSYPILATLAVINLVDHWNDLLWPLVTVQDPSKQVIAVGLLRLTAEATDRDNLLRWVLNRH